MHADKKLLNIPINIDMMSSEISTWILDIKNNIYNHTFLLHLFTATCFLSNHSMQNYKQGWSYEQWILTRTVYNLSCNMVWQIYWNIFKAVDDSKHITLMINPINTLRPIEAETKWLPFFSNISYAFSSMKMFEFWLNFHRSSFLRLKLTINQHWFR